MARKSANTKSAVRPLGPGDLERLIAIDKAHTGRARRRFFEKRLEAASRRAEDFIHIAIERNGRLAGFLLARILHGEFGRDQPLAVLDVIGVDPDAREHGYGRALMQGLTEAVRRKGVQRILSQAEWTNHALLDFFAAAGFELAPRMVLERAVSEPLIEATEEP
jgi:L-amino acid N-acyltransferase YncA